MRLGVRGRVLAVSATILVTCGIGSATVLEAELRRGLEQRVQDRLRAHARAAREALTTSAREHTPDTLIDRLGKATGSRITLIGANGQVIGDSERSGSLLEAMDDHGDRPEVRAAREQGLGVARRHSSTLDQDMLYVAVEHAEGAVRAAVPLTDVDEAVARLRGAMAVAGLVGLIVALLMSALASHMLSRSLRDLVGGARALREGRSPDSTLPTGRTDELGTLARALRRLSEGRQQSLEALGKERDRLDALLDGMRQGVLGLDDGRIVRFANDSAKQLLDLVDDPVGRPLADVVRHPAVLGLLQSPDTHAAVDFDLEGPPRRSLVARLTPQDASPGAVLVLDDATELRRLQRVREDFVANVSHELRTPVSVIQANTETLLNGAMEDRDTAREFLESSHATAVRMGRLVSDLLDLAQIEAGGVTPDMSAVDMTAALERAATTARVSAEVRGTEVTVEAEAGLRARADGQALDQVLLNLTDNAIKYTPEGSKVRLRTRQVDGRIRIEVVDNGPGIDSVHESRVFERFYRVDAGRSRAMGGTGLGLAIVKHLVERMGGAVGVDAAEPCGASFWVELPSA